MAKECIYAKINHGGNFAGLSIVENNTVDVSDFRRLGEIDVLLPEEVTTWYGKTIKIVADNEVLTEVTYIQAAEPGQEVVETTEAITIRSWPPI